MIRLTQDSERWLYNRGRKSTLEMGGHLEKFRRRAGIGKERWVHPRAYTRKETHSHNPEG